MVFAVAGATIIASAHNPNSTWLFHSPESSSFVKSLKTGFLDKVESVNGVIKSSEASVIITLTEAPALINNRMINADL